MHRSEDELVSVVVPVYGSEQFLEPCVESILGQTYRNIEVILVDDGSPDRSGEICDQFARSDRRIRVIHQANEGLVNARKAGVRAASGGYLSFIDGDDWVGSEYLERMHEVMASSWADLAVSGHVREFMGRFQPIPPRISPGLYDRQDLVESVLPQALFNGAFFQHGVSTYVWNKMFKRDRATTLVQEIPSAIVMGEDAALTYPYLIACERVAVCVEGDYFYRQRHGSIVKSVAAVDAEYQRLSTLAQFLTERFAAAPPSARLDEQLRQYFYSLVLTRTGGIISTPNRNEWFSPFEGLVPGSSVVICSSGTFGQHLFAALSRMDGVEVVGWIDDDAEESQRLGLPVTPLESVVTMDFDLVLVASIDPEFTDAASAALEHLGTDRSKISRVRPDLDALDAILTEVGFDMESYAYHPVDSERGIS